jgi:hypothetical protein
MGCSANIEVRQFLKLKLLVAIPLAHSQNLNAMVLLRVGIGLDRYQGWR